MKSFTTQSALIAFLQQYNIDVTEIIETLLKLMTPIAIKNRKVIFTQGEHLQYIYFLPQGIVRYFVMSKEGKELTKVLRIGPTFIGSTYAMAKNKEASFTAEALQDLTVHAIEIKEWYRLIDNNHLFAKLYLTFLQDIFIEKEQNELSLLKDSPENRYQQFQDKYAFYINDIPQWMIATCLGITPEALSRIKGRRLKNF